MFCSMYNKLKLMKKALFVVNYFKFSNISVGVIGAPLAKGQSKFGVEEGPTVLREHGLIEKLKDLNIDVNDYGDLAFPEIKNEVSTAKLNYPFAVGSACQKVSSAVKDIIRRNEKCLTLGGDHSLAIGTVHGHSQVHNNLCILWIDAHPDINTESTTYSGHIHGMSCSFIIKELKKYSKQCSGFHWLEPCIKKKNVAYIGLRDIDPLEKLILKNEEILHFSMRDIDRLGISEVTNRAFDAINPTGKLPLHVSFDVDSIDKIFAPCTGTPVLGGLSLREAVYIAEEIAETNTLSALDFVEINPILGDKKQIHDTVTAAILVIKAFFGSSRSGNLPKDISVVPV